MDLILKEKIVNERNKSIKVNSNKFLIRFIIIFFVGYLFFFTSPFWMPLEYSDVRISKIGESIKANDREVTLSSLKYSEKQHMAEVIFEIDNSSIDGVNEYKWTCVDRNKGMFDVELIVETDNLVVLHIVNMPRRFSEISIRMDIKKGDEIKVDEFSTIKFYTSKKVIDRCSNIEERKGISSYKKEAIKNKISYFEDNIIGFEDEIKEQKQLIENAEITIKNLESKKTYQTEDEIIETDEKISQVESEISSCKDKIDEKEAQIKQNKEKIAKQKEHLEMLGGKND